MSTTSTTKKTPAAERTADMWKGACCPRCGSSEHDEASCPVVPETKQTRQLALFGSTNS